MDENKVTAIRNNVGDAARLVNDLSDALTPLRLRRRVGVDALERIEDDLLAIGALAD